MKPRFKIKSDLEFYCYLKANLPSEYSIISEPEKSYFNEWNYCYKIFYKDELIDKYIGNFRNIEKGYLIIKANQLVKKYRALPC